jgi:hypothetical protein
MVPKIRHSSFCMHSLKRARKIYGRFDVKGIVHERQRTIIILQQCIPPWLNGNFSDITIVQEI